MDWKLCELADDLYFLDLVFSFPFSICLGNSKSPNWDLSCSMLVAIEAEA